MSLENWLNRDLINKSKLDNNFIGTFDKYYIDDEYDTDLVHSKQIVEYNNLPDTMIVIKKDTNRYHCNYLFKKMVDYCIYNKQNYILPSDNKDILFVYPEFKDAFYSFCKKNTYNSKK